MKPEDLLSCCGAYCGHCARWHEYNAFRKAAKLLAELADAHGFQHWMPDDVKEFDYKEFRKGLEFFASDDSWLVCKTRCQDSYGMGHCGIRKCCQEHGVETCFDCPDYPCDRIKDHPFFAKFVDEYQKLGKEKWLKQAAERAKHGYELHTRKCYQVSIAESSSEAED